MNHEDQQIVRFFDLSLHQHPASSPAVVGWSSTETQALRFQVLSEIADLTGLSVLDVGCGVGDLFGYLKDTKRTVDYTGIDLHQGMIVHAKRKFPQATFLHQSMDQLETTYDYVMVSGAFNLRLSDNEQYIERMIKQVFSLAKKGVAFNLLSRYAPYDLVYPDLFYYDPGKIFAICKRMASRVTVRHDYLSNDFSVYVYKD